MTYSRGRTSNGVAVWAASFALILAAAISCGGDAVTGDVSGKPGLTVLSGGGQSDTVLAWLPEPVVVELRDAERRPIRGFQVRFTSLTPVQQRGFEYALTMCRVTVPISTCENPYPTTYARDTTDAAGKARIRPHLGTIAGEVLLEVAVPELGYADTVSFTARGGAPVRIHLDVPDSALYVGNAYPIAGTLRDAHDNDTNGPAFTYSAFGTAATIEGQGFRALAIGRAGAVVRSGALVDTAWVSVVPRGTITAFNTSPEPGKGGIVKVELDGSGLRLLAPTTDTYWGTFPNWTADGQVVFETGGYNTERMYVADTLGNYRRLTAANSPTVAETYNAPARDGSIFLSAYGSGTFGAQLWRMATTTAPAVYIGPNPPGNANAWKASPSPTSDELAYSDVNRGGLSILRVSDGTTRVLLASADMPRWSPTGSWIVFNDDSTLYRIRPDGTGRSRVGPVRYYDRRADWSPDERWLIARTHNALELIDVATGATLRVPIGKWLVRPAWKPD